MPTPIHLRQSRSRQITMCAGCEREVGVRISFYGRGPWKPIPKLVRHLHPNGGRCSHSGYSVHPNVVMDREPTTNTESAQ